MKLGFIDGVIIFLLLLVIFALGIIFGQIGEYKKGQVDAINGNIKYQLVVNPDKTSSWEKK